MRWRSMVAAAGLLAQLAWVPAAAQGFQLGALEVTDGWVIATDKPGNALGYFTVHNHGPADWLIGSTCAGAYGTTMNEPHPHQAFFMGLQPMSTDLRPVMVKVPVPANGELVFKPGGDFLMLQDVRWALRPGGEVNCTFIFEIGGSMAAQLPVIAAKGPPPSP